MMDNYVILAFSAHRFIIKSSYVTYLVVVFFNLVFPTAPPVKLQNEKSNRPRDRKRGYIVVTQAPEVLLLLREHSTIQRFKLHRRLQLCTFQMFESEL